MKIKEENICSTKVGSEEFEKSSRNSDIRPIDENSLVRTFAFFFSLSIFHLVVPFTQIISVKKKEKKKKKKIILTVLGYILMQHTRCHSRK